MPQFLFTQQNTGPNNTQLQFVLNDIDAEDLNIIIESVGGNFPAGPLNATCEVSYDGTAYHTIDSGIVLTTGQAKVVKYYNNANRGTTLSLNPLSFPFIRITVPALTGSISAKVTVASRKKFY